VRAEGQIRAYLPAENERLYSEGEGLLRGYLSEEPEVAIDLSSLKSERDRLKDNLREIEGELRRLEAELKGLRQREIATKREIEALATLIELGDARESKPGD
jgi:chromosome segregation ATPase